MPEKPKGAWWALVDMVRAWWVPVALLAAVFGAVYIAQGHSDRATEEDPKAKTESGDIPHKLDTTKHAGFDWESYLHISLPLSVLVIELYVILLISRETKERRVESQERSETLDEFDKLKGVFDPWWTSENRPSVDVSKAAIGPRPGQEGSTASWTPSASRWSSGYASSEGRT